MGDEEEKEEEDEKESDDQSEEEADSTPNKDENVRVFVGGLPWGTTEEQFRKDFEECGEVEHITFPGKIAFVTYKTKEGLNKALKYDGDDYNGMTLKINISEPKGKGWQGQRQGWKGWKRQMGQGWKRQMGQGW